MNYTARLNIARHLAYVFILMLFYVLQSIPNFLVIYGVKPIWVIPCAIAIAMQEGEFAGGIYGALAGLLCDTAGFLLFGFNGFIVALCCIIAGLLVIYLMRNNMLTCLMFTLVTMLLRGSIEYFFAYGMWQYENSWRIFTTNTLPTVAYSIVIAAPIFVLIRFVHLKLSPYEEDKI